MNNVKQAMEDQDRCNNILKAINAIFDSIEQALEDKKSDACLVSELIDNRNILLDNRISHADSSPARVKVLKAISRVDHKIGAIACFYLDQGCTKNSDLKKLKELAFNCGEAAFRLSSVITSDALGISEKELNSIFEKTFGEVLKEELGIGPEDLMSTCNKKRFKRNIDSLAKRMAKAFREEDFFE